MAKKVISLFFFEDYRMIKYETQEPDRILEKFNSNHVGRSRITATDYHI